MCYISSEEGHIARDFLRNDSQTQECGREHLRGPEREHGRRREQGSNNESNGGHGRKRDTLKKYRFEQAFVAALKHVDDSESGSENGPKQMANTATVKPEYSEAESDDTSVSNELKAHAVFVFLALNDQAVLSSSGA